MKSSIKTKRLKKIKELEEENRNLRAANLRWAAHCVSQDAKIKDLESRINKEGANKNEST